MKWRTVSRSLRHQIFLVRSVTSPSASSRLFGHDQQCPCLAYCRLCDSTRNTSCHSHTCTIISSARHRYQTSHCKLRHEFPPLGQLPINKPKKICRICRLGSDGRSMYFFFVAPRRNAGHGLLIYEVSRPHKTTHQRR